MPQVCNECQPGTMLSKEKCIPCPGDKFSIGKNQLKCMKPRTCTGGVIRDATKVQDTVCDDDWQLVLCPMACGDSSSLTQKALKNQKCIELYGAFSPDISYFLPHFRVYEVVSLHMCVLPYKYRKTLEMLPELMRVCAITGSRYENVCTELAVNKGVLTSISPVPLPHFRLYEGVSLHMCVLLYIYRKMLKMLPQLKLAVLCEKMGRKACSRSTTLSKLHRWTRTLKSCT